MGQLANGLCLVLTPDGDVHEEAYDPENDIEAFRVMPGGAMPRGSGPVGRHALSVAPTANEIEANGAEAEQLARLRGRVMVAAALAVAGPAAADAIVDLGIGAAPPPRRRHREAQPADGVGSVGLEERCG